MICLLVVAATLSACNKPQTSGNCLPYRGVDSPLTVVPGLVLGDPLSSVVECELLLAESLAVHEDAVDVDGYFISNIPAHYTLYFDSAFTLYLAQIFPTFDSHDTAYAGRIFSDILEYNKANYGSPTTKRGASSTHVVQRFEWHVCDGLNEVMEYASPHEWVDTATRWINITIYIYIYIDSGITGTHSSTRTAASLVLRSMV